MSIDQLPQPGDHAIIYPTEPTNAAPSPVAPVSESAESLWQLLMAFLTWVASCFFLLFVPLLVALPYIVYQIQAQGNFQPESLGTDKTVILLSLLGVIPAHALTLALAWAIVTRWGKRPFWETISWSWPNDAQGWQRIMMLSSTVVLAGGLLGLGWLITSVLGGEETQIDQLIKSSFSARLATAFLAAVTAPFVEEVIYRGILYPAVNRAFGAVCAVLVVSLMFTGVHLLQYHNNVGVIAVIAMLSLVLTLVRALTGRLLPCFLIHLVFNGIQSITIVAAPYIESHRHADKVSGAIIDVIGYFISQLV